MPRSRSHVNAGSVALALVLAAGAFQGMPALAAPDALPTPPASPAPQLTVSQAGGRTTLSLGSGRPFHTTDRPVLSERAIALAGSPTVIALWQERLADGSAEHWYAISLDGRTFDRVRPTTYNIRLRYADFDPLAGEPVVPASLAAPADAALAIVQCVVPPLPEMQDQLRAAGATVDTFLADHAMIVRMDAGARERVAALPFVRWTGPFHGAYKLDESILAEILNAGQRGADPAPVRKYSIMLVERGPGAQKVVSERLAALGGTVDLTIPEGYRIEATMSLEQLRLLTMMDVVQFADLWGAPEPDMNIAREIGGAILLESLTGYTGQGVRGEVMDSGLRTTHVDFGARPPILHGANSTDTSHGTSTYGIIFGAGTANAQGRGMLSMSQGIIATYTALTNRYTHTARLVDPAGPYTCVFQSNSWGSPLTPSYNTISAEMDDLLFINDILICNSQSNAGSTSSRPQAWAKNIVSIGGIKHQNTLTRADDNWTGGASIGPAADGRIKPDLAHFYDNVFCTSSSSNTSYTSSFGGTSAATPITSGHFGLFFQMWRDGVFGNPVSGGTVFEERPHMSTAKAIMINTAYRYTFAGSGADLSRFKQGWGMADLTRLYNERAELFIVNETDLIAPLGVNRYTINVPLDEPELRITLVYTDRMGVPNSLQHRINDLTLKVISPSGAVYYGNNGLTVGNVSTPGGSPNIKDTVENVFLPNPAFGAWTVEILGDEILQDTHLETPAIDADYALVAVGGTPIPPTITILVPNGTPASIEPGVAASVDVRIIPGSQGVVPGSPTLHYRDADGAYMTFPLTSLGGELYQGTLPAVQCDDVPEFYFSVMGDGGAVVTTPPDAPATVYTAEVGVLEVAIADNFETDQGWTVTNLALTSGAWVRAVPVSNGGPQAPIADFDGSGRCYVTGNLPNEDVGGGTTILTSPLLDLSSMTDASLSYARWFRTGNDALVVQLSNDDGVTWTTVEAVGNTTGWSLRTVQVSDFVEPTSQVRLRFSVSDIAPSSITEAAIDAVSITTFGCESCPADFDGDGMVSIQDFLAFLGAYSAGDPRADFTGDGMVNVGDVLAFLSAYSAGCP